MSDLISREAVKKAIQNYFIGKIENHVYEIDVVDCNAEICHEVIDNIPTAYDVDKVVEAIKFKQYFDELYGTGLEVANWHLNGDLEAFDDFYESALQEGAVKDE